MAQLAGEGRSRYVDIGESVDARMAISTKPFGRGRFGHVAVVSAT
jgi:hypothetical protein